MKVLADRINVFRSADDGATFDGPINATPGFGTNTTGFELGQIAVDNSSQDGSGYGNVYVAWNELRPYSPYWIVRVTRSTDDGLTWRTSGGVIVPAKPGNPLNHGLLTRGSSLTVGPDHAIYVTVVTYNGSFKSQDIVISRSTDEGQTFGNAVVVTHLTSNNVPGGFGMTDSSGQLISASIIPQTAVNPSNGDLYVIYPDKPKDKTDKADIFFTQSTDGGATWSGPLRVNDDATTNDQWQPALAVTPDGSHVGIFWYDRRLDPANNLIDRFGAVGHVSGHTVTFGANFRITDESFPPRAAWTLCFRRTMRRLASTTMRWRTTTTSTRPGATPGWSMSSTATRRMSAWPKSLSIGRGQSPVCPMSAAQQSSPGVSRMREMHTWPLPPPRFPRKPL